MSLIDFNDNDSTTQTQAPTNSIVLNNNLIDIDFGFQVFWFSNNLTLIKT